MTNRDTQVVVQELFRNGERSVLVAGYELYQAEPVFRTLADRMAEQPTPSVRMFLNVKRPFGETSTDSELVTAFAYRFRTEHWPTDRALPEICVLSAGLCNANCDNGFWGLIGELGFH